MFNFGKKRREAEQQRKFEVVRDVQEAILALQARIDEPTRPATVQDELDRVKSSIERGLRDDRGYSA